jgi:hypothetical protein
MTTYAVGDKVRPIQYIAPVAGEVGEIVRICENGRFQVEFDNGAHGVFHAAELKLEPVPDAQTTLTQALEALRESQRVLEHMDKWYELFNSDREMLHARIAANRALLQAARAEPDAAGSEG